jgi:hypothetical protein
MTRAKKTFNIQVHMCILVPNGTKYIGMRACNGHFQVYIDCFQNVSFPSKEQDKETERKEERRRNLKKKQRF